MRRRDHHHFNHNHCQALSFLSSPQPPSHIMIITHHHHYSHIHHHRATWPRHFVLRWRRRLLLIIVMAPFLAQRIVIIAARLVCYTCSKHTTSFDFKQTKHHVKNPAMSISVQTLNRSHNSSSGMSSTVADLFCPDRCHVCNPRKQETLIQPQGNGHPLYLAIPTETDS